MSVRLVMTAACCAVLVAGCGGGAASSDSSVVAPADPLPLTSVYEWAHADVGIPEGWTEPEPLPAAFEVSSQPGLSMFDGLSSSQVIVMVGLNYNVPGLDVPLEERLASLPATQDLDVVESSIVTMLGYPAEIVIATSEDFARFEARILTDPETAFGLIAYTAPDEMERYRPTFMEMIQTATFKGLLADG